jgi:hypothetical protein
LVYAPGVFVGEGGGVLVTVGEAAGVLLGAGVLVMVTEAAGVLVGPVGVGLVLGVGVLVGTFFVGAGVSSSLIVGEGNGVISEVMVGVGVGDKLVGPLIPFKAE